MSPIEEFEEDLAEIKSYQPYARKYTNKLEVFDYGIQFHVDNLSVFKSIFS